MKGVFLKILFDGIKRIVSEWIFQAAFNELGRER